jgi:hypothetical protein
VLSNGRELTLSVVLEAIDSLSLVRWEIRRIDCAGDAEAAARLLDREWEGWVSDEELRAVARMGVQLIDAHLVGIDRKGEAVVELHAIDNSWWDIVTAGDDLFARMRSSFGPPTNVMVVEGEVGAGPPDPAGDGMLDIVDRIVRKDD